MPNWEWWSADGYVCLMVILHMMTIMTSPYVFWKGMKIKFSKYRLHLKVMNFVIPNFTLFFSMCSLKISAECWWSFLYQNLVKPLLGCIVHAWKMQICSSIFGRCLHMHTHSRQSFSTPHWDTADTEIQVPSVANPEVTDLLPLKPGEGHSLYRAMQLLLLPGVCVCVHACVCVYTCVCVCVCVCMRTCMHLE